MELLRRRSAPELDENQMSANNSPTPEFHECAKQSGRASVFNKSIDSSSRTSDFNESAEQSGHAPTVGFDESVKASRRASAPGFDGNDELLTHPFPPVFDENSEILILGSFPSVKSRGEGFFYAHPRNRFWKVMEFILAKRMSDERFSAETAGILTDERLSAETAGILTDERLSADTARVLTDERFSADTARVLSSEPRVSQRICSDDFSGAAEAHPETPLRTRDGKILLLRELRFALWDVCAACSLEGSADSSIKSVVPNDLSPIFSRAKLKGVVTNGKTADALYRRYLLEKTGVEPLCLPSTSPANAAWSDEKLCRVWYDEISRLDGRS